MGSKVRKAVITAAGRGTRQYPASSAVQKEMFPLVDAEGLPKPIIQIVGEEAIAAGVESICIVTQPGEERQYRQYFKRMTHETLQAFRGKDWAILAGERLEEFGQRLSFVSQDSPEGFGHAVLQARDFVGDEPFLLLLGDHIYLSDGPETCAAQLLRRFEELDMGALSAVHVTPAALLHLFGTMQGRPLPEPDDDAYEVLAIVEKPTLEEAAQRLRTPGLARGHYLCHFGMHVFPPAIFEALDHLVREDVRHNGEIQLTAAQEWMREHLVARYGACVIGGRRYDTGIPYGLMESQIALALAGPHRGAIVEAIARLLAEQLRGVSER